MRDDGIVVQNIQLLIEESEVTDRDSYPKFTPDEFKVSQRYRPDNTPNVFDLILELEDCEQLRQEAADHLNEVLKDAVREWTGLSNTQLRNVFDDIRKDLKERGQDLALFIEDVSVMGALDEEVLVAVEPVNRSGLCRMIAVLGLTHQGWTRMRDNYKQRIDYPVSVGEESSSVWAKDVTSIAEFSARYLNSVRLEESKITHLANDRRNGKEDVIINACDECDVNKRCHSIFGSVNLNGTEIGMFPFSTESPQALLDSLREDDRKTPRGLLNRGPPSYSR